MNAESLSMDPCPPQPSARAWPAEAFGEGGNPSMSLEIERKVKR